MNKLPTEIAGMARHALEGAEHAVEHAAEHGRDAVVDQAHAGRVSMSHLIDRGSAVVRTLQGVALGYASLRGIVAAIDGRSAGRRLLHGLGLQRRRSVFGRIVLGTAAIAVSAGVGAGVALLLAPKSGAETRAQLAARLGTAQRKASDAVHELEAGAMNAMHSVEAGAMHAMHSVEDGAMSTVHAAEAAASDVAERVNVAAHVLATGAPKTLPTRIAETKPVPARPGTADGLHRRS